MVSRVELVIDRSVGVKSPFWSAGSFRIVLPSWFAREYGGLKKNEAISGSASLDEVPFVFYSTDKGILVTPLTKALNDPVLRDVLGVSDKLRGPSKGKATIPKVIVDDLDRRLDEETRVTPKE